MDRRDVTEKRGIYRTVKTKDNRNNGEEGCRIPGYEGSSTRNGF